MGKYRGIVTNTGESYDRLRLYPLDAPGIFLEFAVSSVRSLTEDRQGDPMLAVHVLDIADENVVSASETDAEVDRIFGEAAGNPEAIAYRAARDDPRDANRSIDGSAFKCCYTVVYE